MYQGQSTMRVMKTTYVGLVVCVIRVRFGVGHFRSFKGILGFFKYGWLFSMSLKATLVAEMPHLLQTAEEDDVPLIEYISKFRLCVAPESPCSNNN